MGDWALGKWFPWRTFYRVILVQFVFVVAILLGSGVTARSYFKHQFTQQTTSQLRDGLMIVARDFKAPATAPWCGESQKHTIIQLALYDPSGTLVCASSNLPESVRGAKPKATPGAFRTAIHHDFLWGDVPLSEGYTLRGGVEFNRFSQTMQWLDRSLAVTLMAAALALGLIAVWVARRLTFPLGRLLLKTKRMVSEDPGHLIQGDLSQEEGDDWLDLETSIEDIRRDLAAKTQSLSREQVELETILSAISDAILAVDPEGTPLFYNSRFELLFGNVLRGEAPKLWGMFRDPEVLGAFQSALKEGRPAATRVIPVSKQDGPRRYFALSVSPLRREVETIYGAVGVFHDVTELKAAEQMRIDFVANVSHELRTPLTVIKGYADTLIQDHGETGVSTEYLTNISRNADRLTHLMNDLLDLSSIESDSFIQKEHLSTEEVTQRILRQLRGAYETKFQKVDSVIKAHSVFADPQRLEQVLVNLLDNAIKYTPPKGTIKIAWENSGQDVLLKVKDSGPGIPAEHHARLFERFYRVDKARSREQGGTGLGLAIVKHIMQRHEGTIWVESTPGDGATFTCRFPPQR